MSIAEIMLLGLITFLGGVVWGLFSRVRKLEKRMNQVLAVFDGSGIPLARKIDEGSSYVRVNHTQSWEDIPFE